MNLLKELPYYGYDNATTHNKFNSLLADQFTNGKSPRQKSILINCTVYTNLTYLIWIKV